MQTGRRISLFITSFFCFVAAGLWAQTPWLWWNIPHLAYGGGYTSYLTIRDPQAVSSRWIYVYLYDDNGALQAANVDGVPANTNPDRNSSPYYGSSFYLSLSASQERTFAITGTSALKVGSVQIAGESIGHLSASLRFTTTNGSGTATDVVGILPAEPNSTWTVSVEKRSSTDYTGIAVANPYSDPMTFTVDFYQNGNRVPNTQSRTFTLPGLGHVAKFVHESALFGNAWNNFSGIGTLRISSTTSTFSAVALRGDGNQYSSLPADAGVQNWNVTYAGVVGTVTWTWRFIDGYTFAGYEQDQEGPNQATQKARLRGVLASDVTPQMFAAEWIYTSSDGSIQGLILFQGLPGKEGGTDVINGTRTDLNKDGTQKSQVTFKATRIF